MEANATQIEQIVAEVLARLRAIGVEGRPGAKPLSPSVCAESTLRLNDDVVTMSSLQGDWSDYRRVLVKSRAVVTPAVRDELRRGNVQLVREDPEVREARTLARRATGVAVGTDSDLRSTFARHLPGPAEAWNLSEAATNLEAIPRIVAAAQINQPSILWTPHPAEALCLANRNREIWAFRADTPAMVSASKDEIAANVLVVDRGEIHAWAARRIIDAFIK